MLPIYLLLLLVLPLGLCSCESPASSCRPASAKRRLLNKALCPARIRSNCEVSSKYDPDFLMFNHNLKHKLRLNSSREQILAAGFQPSKPTTVLVHGWQQSFVQTEWLQRSNELQGLNLRAGENLIIMDWRRAASKGYGNAVAKVNAMGARLARFLERLFRELALDRRKLHLVGHSLGSHVVAVAALELNPKVGRLTSLDAAGPCFAGGLLGRLEVKLRPEIAQEVIIYHYDDEIFGLAGQQGHADIYINGGKSQPGCELSLKKVVELTTTLLTKRSLSTSHTRSTEVASVNLAASQCQQVAYECHDYATFLAGHCGYCDQQNNQCLLMGLSLQYGKVRGSDRLGLLARPGNKRLYIATDKNETFCMHHHQILVHFSPHRYLFSNKQDLPLSLQLTDELGRHFELQLANRADFGTVTHLWLTDGLRAPARLVAARLRLADEQAPADMAASSVEINYMSNIDFAKRQALSSRLCPQETVDSWTSYAECSRDE